MSSKIILAAESKEGGFPVEPPERHIALLTLIFAQRDPCQASDCMAVDNTFVLLKPLSLW